MLFEGEVGIDEAVVIEEAGEEDGEEEGEVEWEFLCEDGVEVGADIGCAGIGGEIVELGIFLKRVDALQHTEEEFLGLLRSETKRVEVDAVFANM